MAEIPVKDAKKLERTINKLNKTLENSDKIGDNLVNTFDNVFKAYNKITSTFKGIDKAGKSFQSFLGVIQEIDSNMKEMGVNNSQKLKEIINKANEAANAYKEMNRQAEDIDNINEGLAKTSKLFDSLKQSAKGVYKKDQIKDLGKHLEYLSKQIDPETFKELQDAFSVFETGNINNSMEVSAKLIHAISKAEEEAAANAEKMRAEIESQGEKAKKKFLEMRDKAVELRNEINEAYHLNLNIAKAKAEAQDFMEQLQLDVFNIQKDFGEMFDDGVEESKKLEKSLKEIENYQLEIQNIQNKIDKLNENDRDGKDKLLEQQKKIELRLKNQLKVVENIHDEFQLVSDAAREVSQRGFGEDRAKNLQKNILKANFAIRKFNNFIKLSPEFAKKLDASLKGVAESAGKLAIPVALVAGAISITKKLMEADQIGADLFKTIADTSLMAAQNFEKGPINALDTYMDKARNMKGLASAALGGKELVLGREQILGTVNELDKAGMAARTLKDQMTGVETTTAAVGNELLGASNIVTTFSTDLGVARGEISGMMGDMAYQFNATMGGMIDTFTSISNSAQESGMSTNKFLGIVQTATAGLSLYEEQVASVAAIVGKMGGQTNLTGKQAEVAAQGLGEFFQSSDKAAQALALLGDQDLADVTKTINVDIEALSKKGTPEAKQQIRHLEMIRDLMKSNPTEAAARMKYATADVQRKVLGPLLNKIYKEAQGSAYEMEKIAPAYGVGNKLMERQIQTFGDVGKALGKDFDKTAGKNFKEKQEKAIDIHKRTESAVNELAKATKEKVYTELSKHTSILMAISMGIALMNSGKILKALGGAGGLIGKAGEKGLLRTGLGELGSKVKTAGVGGMAKGARGMLNTGGGAMLAGGAAIGAIANLYKMIDGDATKVMEEMNKEFDERDVVSKFLHPVDSLTVLGDKLTKGVMDFFDIGGVSKEEMAEAERKAKERYEQQKKARATKLATGGTITKTGMALVHKGEKVIPPGKTAGGGTTNVTININGGDLDRVRKVVREEVYKAKQGTA